MSYAKTGLLMAGLAQAQPVQLTDDRGRAVTLPRPPQRIARCSALSPSPAAPKAWPAAPWKRSSTRDGRSSSLGCRS